MSMVLGVACTFWLAFIVVLIIMAYVNRAAPDPNTPKRPVGPPPGVRGLFRPQGPVSEFGWQQGASGKPRGGSFRDRFPHSTVDKT